MSTRELTFAKSRKVHFEAGIPLNAASVPLRGRGAQILSESRFGETVTFPISSSVAVWIDDFHSRCNSLVGTPEIWKEKSLTAKCTSRDTFSPHLFQLLK